MPSPVIQEANQLQNSFKTIWLQPRQTLRRILQVDPDYMTLPLVMLAGISNAVEKAAWKNTGDVVGLVWILLACVLVGPMAGVIGWFLNSWLLRWTGKLLDGKATLSHLRAALAWASVPNAIFLLVSVVLIAVTGESYFKKAPEQPDLPLFLLMIVDGLVGVVLGIWGTVIAVQCIAEVQQFSVWRSVANLLLVGAVYLGLFLALAIPLVLLFTLSGRSL